MPTEASPVRERSPLGDPAPDQLVDARLQVHWAAQVLAAAGQTFAEPRDDDSHRGFVWDGPDGVFVGDPLSSDGHRLWLDPATLALTLRHADGGPVDALRMYGATLETARRWVAERVGALRAHGPEELARPEYDLPEHEAGGGTPFCPAAPQTTELARWFARADAELRRLANARSDASEVRVWPHHFDIATLIRLDPPGSEPSRTVGVGMTPGDTWYAQPYWYVTPYPYPDTDTLPGWDGPGHWHTDTWTGLVLPGSELVEVPSADDQDERLRTFVDAAVAAATEVLEPARE